MDSGCDVAAAVLIYSVLGHYHWHDRLGRGRSRARTHRNLPPAVPGLIFPVILITNCVMAYPYAKREIITVAGAFYALAAFAAAQHTIDRFRQPGRGLVQTAMCVVLCGVAVAWAVRSAGVHHMIQTQAFRERLEWARLDPDRLADRTYRSDASARALASQLRQEALDMRIANPSRLPRLGRQMVGGVTH